jgi:hypothetical protein
MSRPFVAALIALLAALLNGAAPAAAQTSPQPVIEAALQKTLAATRYVMEMDVSLASGNVPKATLVGMTNRVNGKDSDVTLRGMFTAMLGADPTSGVHIITVAGQSYVRGPIPLLGAPEARWYRLDGAQQGTILQSTNTGLMIDQADRKALAALKPLGTQPLNGQRCALYGSTDPAVVGKVLGADAASLTQPSARSVEQAEVKIWVCPDGYFHRMEMTTEGANPNKPDERAAAKILLAFSQINGTVNIAAPRDAVPLAAPSGGITFPSQPAAPVAPAVGPTATVRNGGNLRAEPNLQGRVLDQVNARETVSLLAKSADSRWFKITNVRGVSGWVSATLLTVSADAARSLPAVETTVPATSGITATVRSSGSVRAEPRLQGQALGKVSAGETVTLLARTRDGGWYKSVAASGVSGWVSVALLDLPAGAFSALPVE